MNDLNPTPEFEEKVRQAMDVPNASPEFVNKLRNELVRGPVKMKSRVMFKPAWAIAFVLALAVLVMSVPGVAAALGRLFGYVPGVGLVENTGNLRVLAEPASVTRDGVTITITNAFVYENRVELAYEVTGVTETYGNEPDMCGSFHPNNDFWSDADADLRLPDGTVVRRDYAGEFQSVNQFAMKPVYAVHISADVTELTMELKCIPFTKLGDVPENWEVPFKLKAVPAGTVVGAPVIEVAQPTLAPTLDTSTLEQATEETARPAPVVTVTLTKVIPMESNTVFYFSMDMENKDPSLISIMPSNVYAIDSTGEKVWLIGNYVWQPFEHPVGSEFQFTTQTKPADGPVTIVVENAVAVYAPLYTDPPQAKPEEMTFTFDAGENPQYGQTWDVNNEFTIAGYHLKVTSIRAANFKDIESLNFPLGSQGFEFGYDFTVESEPSIKLLPMMDIISESPVCYLSNGDMTRPESSPLHYIQLCRDAYPKGTVKVNIWQLSVLLENNWQVTWTP
jgi:hypothetical protein